MIGYVDMYTCMHLYISYTLNTYIEEKIVSVCIHTRVDYSYMEVCTLFGIFVQLKVLWNG